MTRWLRIRLTLDRAIALLLLVPAGPVVLALALIIKRDGGPAFVRLQRVGQHGRTFELWKLRTMKQDSGAARASGAPLTSTADPRITRVGGLLRHWGFDELPQLLNVIAGDMALIGPRPETPEYVDAADAAWNRCLIGRPGVAGPTQAVVRAWELDVITADGDAGYRNRVLPVKLAIDAWYLAHASPWVDVLSVAATLPRAHAAAANRLRTVLARDGVRLPIT
jgi:lipopolysaccharide/colanic/teichoic acid biosynthesis glycosyltransferase